jgi:hypothetical protein
LLQQVSCKHFCCTDRAKELAKLLNEGELIISKSARSLLVPMRKERAQFLNAGELIISGNKIVE